MRRERKEGNDGKRESGKWSYEIKRREKERDFRNEGRAKVERKKKVLVRGEHKRKEKVVRK